MNNSPRNALLVGFSIISLLLSPGCGKDPPPKQDPAEIILARLEKHCDPVILRQQARVFLETVEKPGFVPVERWPAFIGDLSRQVGMTISYVTASPADRTLKFELAGSFWQSGIIVVTDGHALKVEDPSTILLWQRGIYTYYSGK